MGGCLCADLDVIAVLLEFVWGACVIFYFRVSRRD